MTRHIVWLISSLVLIFVAAAPADTLEPADQPAHVNTADRNDRFVQLHESFLKRGKEGKIGVLFIGDSITEGWKLVPDLWNKYYGSYDPANFGISGDRTQSVLWRLQNGELDGIDAAVVVLMIGTNNHNYPAADIARADKRIVDVIHQKLPNSKLLVLGIFPRGADPKDPATAALREKLAQVNGELATLDDGAKTRFLDIGKDFLEPDGRIAKAVMDDGLHPTARGYQIWADAMQPTLSGMMPAETRAERDARMHWWREARFGMFIHWGVYSVPAGRWNGKEVDSAGEWIMNLAKIPPAQYQKLPAQFNPVNFDADRWVQTAQAAGMKYIVITAKHHDGFAMYHSLASPFNIYDATPFKRDPLAELAKACAAHGMKLGFYYSQAQDWNHPGGAAIGGHWDGAQEGSMDDYIRTIAVPQVRELLTGYGPVAVLWWDTPEGMTPARAAPLQALLKLQPNIISNDRLGSEPGDTSTPEQHIPSTGMPGRDWETCMTINNTWGYKTDDTDFKSTETLLHNLIDIASKGGNYLLNVGPTSLGEIPQPEVDRLKQIGQWLTVNGDAIYGTSASPFRRYSFDGRCTVKGDRLFIHAFHWPSDGIRIVGLKTKVNSATFVDGGAAAEVAASTGDDGMPVLTIRPPKHADTLATVVALDLAGPPEVDSTNAMVRAGPGGVIALTADDSTIHGSQAQLEGDHIGYWTNATDTILWDVIAPAAGDYAVQITYACDDRAAGSEYLITAGDSTASGTILPTGNWGAFVTKAAGQLRLKAGAQRVIVSAVSMPRGAVMNLKELRLSPVR